MACLSWNASTHAVSGPAPASRSSVTPFFAHSGLMKAARSLDQGTHGQPLHVRPGRPREPQELRDEVVEPLDLRRDLAQHGEDVGVALRDELGQLLLEDAEVDLERVQRVANLVGDARGQRLDQLRSVRRHRAGPAILSWMRGRAPLAFAHHDEAPPFHAFPHVHLAAGPAHLDAVGPRGRAQAEVQAQVVVRSSSSTGSARRGPGCARPP